MKGFLLLVLLLTAPAFAHDSKKEDILKRVDTLIQTLEEARQDQSCAKAREAFKLYPDHLKDIVANMDLFDKRTAYLRDLSLKHLLLLKKHDRDCDTDTLPFELKVMVKELRKQKKIISNMEADFDNGLYYEI